MRHCASAIGGIGNRTTPLLCGSVVWLCPGAGLFRAATDYLVQRKLLQVSRLRFFFSRLLSHHFHDETFPHSQFPR